MTERIRKLLLWLIMLITQNGKFSNRHLWIDNGLSFSPTHKIINDIRWQLMIWESQLKQEATNGLDKRGGDRQDDA